MKFLTQAAFAAALATALTTNAVRAADIAVKAPPAAVSSGWSWTGFYAGANIGAGWESSAVAYTPNDVNAFLSTCGNQRGDGTCVPPASFNMVGVAAGGQIGYNQQVNTNWLVGVETDLDWSGIRGQSAPSNFILNSYGPAAFVATQEISWFGTLRARVGILPVNPLLIYATGGLAYGGVKESAFMPAPTTGQGGNSNGGFAYACGTFTKQANCFSGSVDEIRAGWTVGAGGEYVVSNNATLRIEYLYVNFGHPSAVNSVATATFGAGNAPSSFTASFGNANFSVVRVGANLKF